MKFLISSVVQSFFSSFWCRLPQAFAVALSSVELRMVCLLPGRRRLSEIPVISEYKLAWLFPDRLVIMPRGKRQRRGNEFKLKLMPLLNLEKPD